MFNQMLARDGSIQSFCVIEILNRRGALTPPVPWSERLVSTLVGLIAASRYLSVG